MSRVLVLASEPVGERMAGPSIRALEVARALAGAGHAATLAAPAPSVLADDRVALLEAGFADFDRVLAAAADHDVLVAQELPAQMLRHVRRLPIRLVADLYNPRPMEVLEAVRDRSRPAQRRAQALATLTTLAMCAAADFIVCASEKQRDLWLGGLALHGLITLDRYRADPSLRSLIDVVPFGLPAEPPRPAAAPVLKGAWPGIGPDDRVLLWGGGIWNWLDAITCIDAVARLDDLDPPVHLVFQGLERPGLEPVDAISGTPRALAHAETLGLLGKRVHVNHDWVPYAERGAWLLEADLGVSAHHDHLEARFSFRTRVLDYLWAGLPYVGTARRRAGRPGRAPRPRPHRPAGGPRRVRGRVPGAADRPGRVGSCGGAHRRAAPDVDLGGGGEAAGALLRATRSAASRAGRASPP